MYDFLSDDPVFSVHATGYAAQDVFISPRFLPITTHSVFLIYEKFPPGLKPKVRYSP